MTKTLLFVLVYYIPDTVGRMKLSDEYLSVKRFPLSLERETFFFCKDKLYYS